MVEKLFSMEIAIASETIFAGSTEAVLNSFFKIRIIQHGSNHVNF